MRAASLNIKREGILNFSKKSSLNLERREILKKQTFDDGRASRWEARRGERGFRRGSHKASLGVLGSRAVRRLPSCKLFDRENTLRSTC